MANSILEAVKMGLWDFQPHTVDYRELEASDTMPGTREKLDILAEHLRRDSPKWHSDDCLDEDRLDQKRTIKAAEKKHGGIGWSA